MNFLMPVQLPANCAEERPACGRNCAGRARKKAKKIEKVYNQQHLI
jgi:hypothetical protein